MNENLVALMDRGVELAEPKILNIESRQYSDKKLLPITDPTPDTLVLSTLDSLIDYAKKEAPDDPIVHIASPTEVRLISCLHGNFQQRSVYAKAVCSPPRFGFGSSIGHEEFMIQLQALFVDAGDREIVLQNVGNVADENVAAFEDDGVSQKVTVRAGITRKTEVKVPNPVNLAPYRTFSEVEQPVSPFIFRMKSGSPLPSCALFEADGGRWQLAAVANIKNYLVENLPKTFTIIG